MNILLFSWRGPGHPNAGGAEISTHEHAKGWVSAGHNVTLFTANFKGAKNEETLDGINVKRVGSEIFGVQLQAFIWYLFGSHKKFDLVIDQFHGIPFFTPLYIRTKKLAFIHEVTKEVWKFNSWPTPFNLLPALFGPLFEPFIFKLIYSRIPFITVSDSTKQDLTLWGVPPKNITIVHNGIDQPRKKKLPPKEKNKTLIYLGVLSKDKGIEDAIKVFATVNRAQKGWQFWVVGRSELKYLDYLKKKVKDLGISKKVKFWGHVSEKKKYKLLAKAHVLINPSIREGWGLVVIEAAAMGTPTVAFDVPGLRDSILNGKTGIIDKQHSVNSLASELMDLLSNYSRYQRMRVEAVKWSKKFSWKQSILESLDFINKIIEPY
ncbi:MAG: glycosyltransferase family 4 protein [Patescibacteria group bacterium]